MMHIMCHWSAFSVPGECIAHIGLQDKSASQFFILTFFLHSDRDQLQRQYKKELNI